MNSDEDEAAKFVDGLLEFPMGDDFSRSEETPAVQGFKISIELSALNRKCGLFVHPPAVVLYYGFDRQSDSDRLRGMTGSDLETHFQAFEPSGAYACCNVDGFTGVAVIWFNENLSGMEQALRLGRSFVDRECGQRDFEKTFDLDVAWKEEFYGWVATADDYECIGHYRSKTIQLHLKKIAGVKDLTEMYVEKKGRIPTEKEKAEAAIDFEDVVKQAKHSVAVEVVKRVDLAEQEERKRYDKELADVYDSLRMMNERELNAETLLTKLDSSVTRAIEEKRVICKEADNLSYCLFLATAEKIRLSNEIEDLKHCTCANVEMNVETDDDCGAITSLESDSEKEYSASGLSEELKTTVENVLEDFENVQKQGDVGIELRTAELDSNNLFDEYAQAEANSLSFANELTIAVFNSPDQRSSMDGTKHETEENRTESEILRNPNDKLKKYDAECGDSAIAQKRNRNWEEVVQTDMLLNEETKKVRKERSCDSEVHIICSI